MEPSKDHRDLSFKIYHELMARRVSEILLVSSPYDAYIMAEDGVLAERIIHEYRGLNLSRPPRLTWVSSAREALHALAEKPFHLVITMPRLDDMEPHVLGREIKKRFSNLPVFLLAHETCFDLLRPEYSDDPSFQSSFDELFVWKGNTDLLLAIIKNVEDQMNVALDTQKAKVRVIILVEDSPRDRSSLLPLLYKEIVLQTQAVMEESVNEEHRILRMRARPKILLAGNYEAAEDLYRRFKPYLLSVITDVRFQRKSTIDKLAGISLLQMIKDQSPGVPLLVLSSEEGNRDKASAIPAVFLNKNSPSLHTDIRSFMVQYLAFGDFIFKLPEGKEVARASNLRAMENILPSLPDASVYYHATLDHFSTWLMARSEIQLASELRFVKVTDFSSAQEIKEYLVSCLRESRKHREKGIVIDFLANEFDPETDFLRIGKGSMGGKARGLAFLSSLLAKNPEFQYRFPDIKISVPRTLVVATDCFDSFLSESHFKDLSETNLSDALITEKFLKSPLPNSLRTNLAAFLEQVDHPLSIRSSSLLEDAQYQPYAGVYKTYMIPNNHPDPSTRLAQLERAVRLVYASTYLETPKSFAKSAWHRLEEEKMAVIIQQMVGRRYGDYFFPHISGLAQSFNFYPVSRMKPEQGIAHIALGLGKTVVEGGLSLSFSPAHPQFLPQFFTVDDTLRNSQRLFYALSMSPSCGNFGSPEGPARSSTLAQLQIVDIQKNLTDHPYLRELASTYIPEEHRIRDSVLPPGQLLLTYAGVLKYRAFPLPEILEELLLMGRKGMGCPVEIEFALNLPSENEKNTEATQMKDNGAEFALLQIRPMGVRPQNIDVKIDSNEISRALCFSTNALGNGVFTDIADIVYVKPSTFDPGRSRETAAEIARINQILTQQNRQYLLIGPGRWGSADRFLGIPVRWNDISGAGAIIETLNDNLRVDPSHGSHFFHNILSLGISYITITRNSDDIIDEGWLLAQPAANESVFLRHLTLEKPLLIKIDGKTSCAIVRASPVMSDQSGGQS